MPIEANHGPAGWGAMADTPRWLAPRCPRPGGHGNRSRSRWKASLGSMPQERFTGPARHRLRAATVRLSVREADKRYSFCALAMRAARR